MVAPCDKYQGLVIGPDGQTVADPYGMIPTVADYTEWRHVARTLLDRAEQELLRAFELYGALDPDWDAGTRAAEARWQAMGGWMQQTLNMNFTWGGSIADMVSVAQAAACEIGVIEARIVAMGGDDSDIPTPPVNTGGGKGGGKAAKGGGIGMVLLLGLVVAFASSRRTR